MVKDGEDEHRFQTTDLTNSVQKTAQSYVQNTPGTATLESIPSLQYHTNTADQKYQLLFVVNFVKLHLRASELFKMRKQWHSSFNKWEFFLLKAWSKKLIQPDGSNIYMQDILWNTGIYPIKLWMCSDCTICLGLLGFMGNVITQQHKLSCKIKNNDNCRAS